MSNLPDQSQTIPKQQLADNRPKSMTLKAFMRPPVKKGTGTSFILGDISGSMSGRKMESLKDAYRSCWQPGVRALVFGSDVYEVESRADIDTLHIDGSTSMMKALKVAWQESAAHIILISDGQPTDATKDAILSAAKDAGVPIDTIAISDSGLGFDDSFLQKLAEATSANFNRCEEPLKLTQMVEQLLIAEKGPTKADPSEAILL